jgi:hypothetical protein
LPEAVANVTASRTWTVRIDTRARRFAFIALAAVVLLGATATATAARERLSADELQKLCPNCDLRSLPADKLEAAATDPQFLKLAKQGEAARSAQQVAARAAGRNPQVAAEAPTFEGLTEAKGGADEVGDRLTDEQLREALGPELFAKMRPARRDRWRSNVTAVRLYRRYREGGMKLEVVRNLLASMVETERAPLVTDPNRPLRDQFPKRGKHFALELNVTTAHLLIEKDRKTNGRDQQIANVWAALADEEGDSDIAREFELIATSNLSPGESPRQVKFLLNLRWPHANSVGAHSLPQCISLGLENPWLSPVQNVAWLRGVICHELGHYLQQVLYGLRPAVGLIARFEGLRHNPEVTTNPSLSFSEGWADYCGVSFGKSAYWDYDESFRHEKADVKQPLKSREDMLQTEGLVTQTLLKATARIPDFRKKALATLARHKPRSMPAFVTAFKADRRAEGAILAQLLEDVLAGRP